MNKTILSAFAVILVFTLFLTSSIFVQGAGNGTGGSGNGSSPYNGSGQSNYSGNGSNGQGNVTGNQTMNQSGNMNQNQVMAGNATQLQQMIQQREQDMEQEKNGLSDPEQQEILQNQNRVRLAVHAFLAMENLVGGIGQNVSEIAKEFNNSVQATIRAEERIEKKSGFSRFFSGGDEKSAEEIENEVEQNRNRIEMLKQLKEQCSCGEEVKAMYQEQIQNLEQEQNRLETKAQNEMKSKGMFGWLWK